tara:strand:+ start:407 stop:580 length:174 start_codon:yes stop_codon:yes gene_type:complete
MNTTSDKPEECCLCGQKMYNVHETNNALPVKNGRCCHTCNQKIVIPARMKEIFGYYM